MSQTIVFTTSSCPWCRRVKRYLTERGAPFKEVDVERNPKAAREVVRRTGQNGVPVVKIGCRWIVGFDQRAIDNELDRNAS